MDDLARQMFPEAFQPPQEQPERKKTEEIIIMTFPPPQIELRVAKEVNGEVQEDKQKLVWDHILETGDNLIPLLGDFLQTIKHNNPETHESKSTFDKVRFAWPNDNLAGEAQLRSHLSPVSAWVQNCPGFYHPTRNEVKVIIGMTDKSHVLVYPRDYNPRPGTFGHDAKPLNADKDLLLRGHIMIVAGSAGIQITDGLVYFLPWQYVMKDWMVPGATKKCEEVD